MAGDFVKSAQMSESTPKHFWIRQFALLAFLAVGLAKSAASGRHLLMAASLWFIAVLVWNQLWKSSFFLGLGRPQRTQIAFVFALGWLYQLFTFGWLAPLAIGMYRAALRR